MNDCRILNQSQQIAALINVGMYKFSCNIEWTALMFYFNNNKNNGLLNGFQTQVAPFMLI